MAPTTVPITAPQNSCPYCGKLYTVGDIECPHCHETLHTSEIPTDLDTRPLKLQDSADPLTPKETIVLEVVPSGARATLKVENMLILGRTLGPGTEDVFDLTAYKGHRRGVSRRHCVLRRYADRLVVIDLGSMNGTFVNNQRLEPHKECTLQHGDTLILGDMIMIVHFDA